MTENLITRNKFDPQNTKTVIVHDGRFHADDMMFAAMATIAAGKYRNKIEIQRTGVIPSEYTQDVIVGDMGFGVYDHHTDIEGNPAFGSLYNTETYMAASCGLLYRDVKDILFNGDSETKKLFEALIDIIEHCDNTSDNNTFSDSINFLTPVDETKYDDQAALAIEYCKAVISGFMLAHEKEKSGKIWAVPKVCSGVVPGVPEKRDSRYWKASNQIKNKYKYISHNNESDVKLRSLDTYSLACGAMNDRSRQRWRGLIENSDREQIVEMERREREEWPKAVAEMQNRTILLENYFPYGPYVKGLSALFVVAPSQRGGYTVTALKTKNGKYRFNPDLLIRFEGCSFAANDKRFVFFDTKEHALKAAHTAGMAMDKYLSDRGFAAYRDIYGGCSEYAGDFFQDLIGEDIALNIYAKEIIKDVGNLTMSDYRKLQVAVMGNPYLIHSFCSHFRSDGDKMRWDDSVNVINTLSQKNKEGLLQKDLDGHKWNSGLANFLKSNASRDIKHQVDPLNMLEETYEALNSNQTKSVER